MSNSLNYRFLCRSLRSHFDASDSRWLTEQVEQNRIDWPQFVALASELMVSPALASRWRIAGLNNSLPDEVLDYFEAIADLNTERNAAVCLQTQRLVELLNEIGVEPVLLKGAGHLISNLYQCPGERFLRDIDLLVPAETIPECVALLNTKGYRSNPDQIFRADDTHFPPLSHPDEPVCVELHQHVLSEKCRTLLSAEHVRVSAIPVEVGSGKAWLMNPVDRVVLHVAHTQIKHRNAALGSVSLRQLLDLEPLAALIDTPATWEQVRLTFAAQRLESVLQGYLHIGNQLLGTPWPPELRRSWRSQMTSWKLQLTRQFPCLQIPLACWLRARSFVTRVTADEVLHEKIRSLGWWHALARVPNHIGMALKGRY